MVLTAVVHHGTSVHTRARSARSNMDTKRWHGVIFERVWRICDLDNQSHTSLKCNTLVASTTAGWFRTTTISGRLTHYLTSTKKQFTNQPHSGKNKFTKLDTLVLSEQSLHHPQHLGGLDNRRTILNHNDFWKINSPPTSTTKRIHKRRMPHSCKNTPNKTQHTCNWVNRVYIDNNSIYKR